MYIREIVMGILVSIAIVALVNIIKILFGDRDDDDDDFNYGGRVRV